MGLLIVTIVFLAIIVFSLINPTTIKKIDQIEEITWYNYGFFYGIYDSNGTAC